MLVKFFTYEDHKPLLVGYREIDILPVIGSEVVWNTSEKMFKETKRFCEVL